MGFVFRWCTDFSPEDPGLEGDASAQRKILSSNSREVLYEDLDQSPEGGWLWSRWKITLRPPDRWHGEAIGSTRGWSGDYQLRSPSFDRTELTLRGRRRPARLAGRGPTHRQVRSNLAHIWKLFKQALETDFRKSIQKRTGIRTRTPRRA